MLSDYGEYIPRCSKTHSLVNIPPIITSTLANKLLNIENYSNIMILFGLFYLITTVMSAIPAKIVLKSTTSKTLNDRFTEIARQIKSPPQVTLGGLRMGQMQQSQASSKNRRLAAQMANRPGVQAALGLSPPGGRVQNRLGNQNKGSVQGRLGSNKMTGFRPAGRGGQGGFRGGQGGVQQRIGSGRGGLRKGTGLKRGFGAGAGRGRLNRGGGMSRGVGRGMRGGMGGGRGKAQGSRGAGAARGRGAGRGGRGRGRGRGGQTNPVKSRDALDKELDEYMTQTKGHLDAELDQYMQNVATDDQ